jgi:cytochrome P450
MQTSNTVATVLYYLARNPECQEKLFSEVSKVIPNGPSQPLTSDDLDSMKYLKACIKEAMR